jgi:hypothetical protein
MGKHNSAATDSDSGRSRCDRPNQNLGAHATKTRRAVMLRHPVTVISHGLGEYSEVDRIPQRYAERRAFANR